MILQYRVLFGLVLQDFRTLPFALQSPPLFRWPLPCALWPVSLPPSPLHWVGPCTGGHVPPCDQDSPFPISSNMPIPMAHLKPSPSLGSPPPSNVRPPFCHYGNEANADITRRDAAHWMCSALNLALPEDFAYIYDHVCIVTLHPGERFTLLHRATGIGSAAQPTPMTPMRHSRSNHSMQVCTCMFEHPQHCAHVRAAMGRWEAWFGVPCYPLAISHPLQSPPPPRETVTYIFF